MLKASNWSRSIKETSNNKKNLVTSFVTRTKAFQGQGGGGVKKLASQTVRNNELGNKMT